MHSCEAGVLEQGVTTVKAGGERSPVLATAAAGGSSLSRTFLPD